ncbi:hypothetical protein Syun_023352 [Stephania yunnanensis]|uniref:Uncharacterized protein n=1 Tax=Stephania yunnanensis TaxID=152371 RepID=A0AAP0I3A8_9MAGN
MEIDVNVGSPMVLPQAYKRAFVSSNKSLNIYAPRDSNVSSSHVRERLNNPHCHWLAEEEKKVSSRSGRASEKTICARNEEMEEYCSFSLSLRRTRLAVEAWGLKNCTQKEEWFSDTVTAVVVPSYIDSSEIVRRAWKMYNLSLGLGLNKVAEKVFIIGHLGNLNEAPIIYCRNINSSAKGQSNKIICYACSASWVSMLI